MRKKISSRLLFVNSKTYLGSWCDAYTINITIIIYYHRKYAPISEQLSKNIQNFKKSRHRKGEGLHRPGSLTFAH